MRSKPGILDGIEQQPFSLMGRRQFQKSYGEIVFCDQIFRVRIHRAQHSRQCLFPLTELEKNSAQSQPSRRMVWIDPNDLLERGNCFVEASQIRIQVSQCVADARIIRTDTVASL